MEKNEEAKSNQGWYRSPLIHFPLWLAVVWMLFDFMDGLSDYGIGLSLGLFLIITGLWGIMSKMFFLRVPFLSKYIYENNYIIHVNTIVILIGFIFIVICLLFGFNDIVSDYKLRF